MSGPSERDEIAALGTFLAGLVDGAVDQLAAELLASDWLAERDRRTAAKTLRAASKAALDDCQINAHDRTCDCATTAQWLNDRADWAEVLHQ